jgi:hypothetical protein
MSKSDTMNKAMESLDDVACRGKKIVCASCGKTQYPIGDMALTEINRMNLASFDLMLCIRDHTGSTTKPYRVWDCRFCWECSQKMKERIDKGESIVEQNILSQGEIIEKALNVIDKETNRRTDAIASRLLGTFLDFISKKKIKLGPKQAEELRAAMYKTHDKPSVWTSVSPVYSPQHKKIIRKIKRQQKAAGKK